MSKFFYFFGLVLTLLVTSIHADCHKCRKPKFSECEKTYVGSSQIDLLEDQIYVQLDNRTLLVSALYSDDRGFFFKDFSLGCGDGEWECSNCHACNANYNLYCQVCWK